MQFIALRDVASITIVEKKEKKQVRSQEPASQKGIKR